MSWEDAMRVYLAGGETRHWIHFQLKEEKDFKPYLLESFYYCDSDTEKLLPFFGDFLLDSGAFTFMQNQKKHCDFEGYLEQYADFIVRNKVEKFFELDIDSVVGYEKVLEYRAKLERLTGKQCIPVWHKTRGHKEYIRHCDEYPYIAIGGIVVNEIKRPEYKVFPYMIEQAHKRNAKVHGLGFTNLKLLPEIHFDSVDSTAWTTGNRFGFMYQFNGRTMVKQDLPSGMRLRDSRKIALINFTEWLRFQKFAEYKL